MKYKQKIDKYFSVDGLLSKSLDGFKVRPQQVEATESIANAMSTPGGIAFIEAATGVGKTLAYLIPAMEMASPSRKVVISTHSLALQGQLIERDIPFIQRIAPRKLQAIILKGRGNYLCLQDYDVARGELWTVGDKQFSDIGEWAKTTETGDISELPFTYPGWIDIRANSDTCKAPDCRYYDKCFYYKARNNAQDASIIIVNHALFFSDLAIRRRGESNTIIPDYSFVVFDEAHHLETAAAAAFGISVGSSRITTIIEKVRRLSRQIDIDKDRLKLIEAANATIFTPLISQSKSEFTLKEVLNDNGFELARTQAASMGSLLDSISTELLKADHGGNQVIRDRIDGLRRLCTRTSEELMLIFNGEDKNYLKWGSVNKQNRRGLNSTLHWTPVCVAPILHESLWKAPRIAGAALISATLATDGGFGYLRRRLGVPFNDPDITETVVGSPFDYKEQALLYIPQGMPPPSESEGYLMAVVDDILNLIKASHGGAFLLFTSYRALNLTHEQLTQSELPYPILRQGDMPNARLVEAFKKEENAVLLGTQSFWEGVDIPGHGLRLVVIDKLPFSMPDNPLHRARVEQITTSGGDWFNDYTLPEAQIKLKQGFGRLIRSTSDRGVIAILDSRLRIKSYGRRVIASLPPAKQVGTFNEVVEFYKKQFDMDSFHKLDNEASVTDNVAV